MNTVRFLDICSSCRILEDLEATEEGLRVWEDTLHLLEHHLVDCHARVGIDLYKFVGGWVGAIV